MIPQDKMVIKNDPYVPKTSEFDGVIRTIRYRCSEDDYTMPGFYLDTKGFLHRTKIDSHHLPFLNSIIDDAHCYKSIFSVRYCLYGIRFDDKLERICEIDTIHLIELFNSVLD